MLGMESGQTELLIGLGLFVASEVIGMSRLKSNSVLQLILAAARRAYPYETKRRSSGLFGGRGDR